MAMDRSFFSRFTKKTSQETGQPSQGTGDKGKNVKRADGLPDKSVNPRLLEIRGRETMFNPTPSLPSRSSSVESLRSLRELIANLEIHGQEPTTSHGQKPTTSLEASGIEELDNQRVASEKFLQKVIDHMRGITGFNDENLFEEEKLHDQTKASIGLTEKLSKSLNEITVKDTEKLRGFFKIDHEESGHLSDYLEKDSVRLPGPPEGFPSVKSDKGSINAFLAQEKPDGDFFVPKEALNLLKGAEEAGLLKFLYDSPLKRLRGGETMTLGKHTEAVSWRGETCCAGWWDRNDNPDFKGVNTVLRLKDWRTLLLLHDLGKTLVEHSPQQNLPILILATEVLRKTVPEESADRILAIYQLSIGEIYKQVANSSIRKSGKTPDEVANETAKQIIEIADRFHLSPIAVANVAVAYHTCDAGSYEGLSSMFPIEYDRASDLYKFTRDSTRQQGHTLLFTTLTQLIQDRSKTGMSEIPLTSTKANRSSWMKHKIGWSSWSTPTPDRVNRLITDLKRTTGELEGYITMHFGSLRSHTPGLGYKYDETLDIIVKQTQTSCNNAMKNYGDKQSTQQDRRQRHAAEEELAVMHGRLRDMAEDLEILGPRINALTQPGRENVLRQFTEDYAKVLDGYKADPEGEQARQMARQQFITWIERIP
jgi:hypothetical protein